MRMITVKRMTQTVTLEGKTYGPSTGPISVPEELAAALGLVPVEGEAAPVAAAPEQPADLAEAQAERDRLKGSLERLYGLLGPVRRDGETPDVVLARVLDESAGLKTAQRDRDSADQEVSRLRAELGRAQQEGGDALAQVSTLTADIQRLKGQQEGREGEWTQQRDGLLADVAKLVGEKKALEGRGLPEDAIERIKKVPGVADKYAQPILDALTAPATPAGE